MVYEVDITVPPLTLITQPVSEILKVTKGRVNQISILFPPGCCTLVGIWFTYTTVQVLPWSRNKQLFGAGNMMEFSVNIPIDVEPYQLIIYGFSQDDTYEHTVFITVNIVDEDVTPVASFGEIKP